jgi:membrane fusion protein, multidrug efflux system
LAKLDDSQYKINLEQAQAALHIAQATYKKLPDDVQAAGAAVEKSIAGLDANQASLRSAQIVLDDAQRQLEENQVLFASGAISQEGFKTFESSYKKAQANYEAAVANVASGQASLKAAQITVESLHNSASAVYLAQIEQAQALFNSAKLAEDNTTIYAEYDGTILRIPVSVGENVTAAQTLLTLGNLKSTWVTANIEEKKIDRIKVTQVVDVRIDAYPGKIFSGSVIEVGEASQATFALFSTESSSGSFTKVAQRIPIKIKVDSGEALLKPGMSAVVKIHTR